jgi:hypothetical protein
VLYRKGHATVSDIRKWALGGVEKKNCCAMMHAHVMDV